MIMTYNYRAEIKYNNTLLTSTKNICVVAMNGRDARSKALANIKANGAKSAKLTLVSKY